MTALHRAEYRVPCDTAALAEHVARALRVETQDAPPRTRVEVVADGATLLLRIESHEVRGLRAATNSFLRWANTALEVARIAAGRSPPSS